MCQSLPLFVIIFDLFTLHFKWQIYKWKTVFMLCFGFEPGPQKVGADDCTEPWLPPWKYGSRVLHFNKLFSRFRILTIQSTNAWKYFGQTQPPFVYFRPFLITITYIDVVLGIRTRVRRMVGADESTELRRLLKVPILYPLNPAFTTSEIIANR